MPKLKLISLVCTETEDNTGADEAYIRVNGNKVWYVTNIILAGREHYAVL